MNWNLFNIYSNFNYLRYSLGIMMMLNGFPLIFFIRDTLKIGPASSAFTAVFMIVALLLMTPSHLFKRYYKPNTILFNLGVGFLAISFYYFLFINFQGKAVADYGTYMFIGAFLFLLLHIPNDVKDTLLAVIFVVSLFCNLTLVYSLLTDPNWSPGMRAAVSFSNEGAQPGGNPHITARNGVICMVSAIILLNNSTGVFTRVFLFFSALFSLGVVVMSLAKSSYLGTGLMLGAFFVFRFKARNILTSIGGIFKFSNMIILIIILIGINYFLNRYGDIFNLLLGYWDVFENRIMDVIFTSTGVKLTDEADVDYSAMGRVSGFAMFVKTFFSWNVFLGMGYKYDYLDVPILESFVNHGILGFVFFASFNIFLAIYALREVKNPTNPLTTFLAYLFISMSVLLATGGRPYDIVFWFPYAVMIRFLGIRYTDSMKFKPKTDPIAVASPAS
ncbi:hypothetical protein DYBT9275_03376 [Dyadobacter sp. CECT 9275]|uniref:Uncharacterized protein n=1 Tax=Dyadobacter helix TaxID=2822344 RepID=A0A916JDF3_9BACT|nr:hypothetical protein [Dyadobacter sp. CECT 9275]CAG5004466.1 hypothetical protein DYBT9275_03376 [Dyadobacter sp. CECT 9275]